MAEALKLVRTDDVRWLEDLYPHWTKDSVWLPHAGKDGWLVILRDKKVRSRHGERALIEQHGVGCFILNQKTNPTRWQYLKLVATTLDEMERRFEETARPFIFTVDSVGGMRRVL
ncbi:MAG: hypothetical protein GEU28_02700 [Dehalococcoidia bacterium]|nr:hypothetical protein [Dehalococcoidia bacterium]